MCILVHYVRCILYITYYVSYVVFHMFTLFSSFGHVFISSSLLISLRSATGLVCGHACFTLHAAQSLFANISPCLACLPFCLSLFTETLLRVMLPLPSDLLAFICMRFGLHHLIHRRRSLLKQHLSLYDRQCIVPYHTIRHALL